MSTTLSSSRTTTRTTLFLPGAGGRRAFWGPAAARLRHAGTPIFFAWPGFGDAQAEEGIRSLDELYEWFVARAPAQPCVVVAQSMGGVLAMRFAIEHPERVSHLVLVATSAGTRRRFGIDWRPGFRAERAEAPDWFERDATELDARLAEVRAPALLIFSDADPIAPVAMGEHLLGWMPEGRLVVIQGGTHVFAEERPDEVARAIDAFLAPGEKSK
ncbi:MAG TPA: alpha/beta hydrolase [Polyangiaceae bacterium]|jgi:pimeloyl-ACP methyl ester carboxylesterase